MPTLRYIRSISIQHFGQNRNYSSTVPNIKKDVQNDQNIHENVNENHIMTDDEWIKKLKMGRSEYQLMVEREKQYLKEQANHPYWTDIHEKEL
jgi:hypothetical protein